MYTSQQPRHPQYTWRHVGMLVGAVVLANLFVSGVAVYSLLASYQQAHAEAQSDAHN